MYRQIMVPLDGSALAERALPCAERVAAASGATLHLVRVASPVFAAHETPDKHDTADFLADEMRGAEAYLEQVQACLVATGLTVHTRRIVGTIEGALLEYAQTEGIDLIVMCSHGRTGLARLPLGSIADHLVRHGTTPARAGRAFGPPPRPERAIVPLDGSAPAEEALLALAALRAADPGRRPIVRKVTLLRVVGSQEEGLEAEHYREGVARWLQRQGLVRGGERGCDRLVVFGDPAQAIVAAAEPNLLVVMATHGRSGLMRWALGSVADRVVTSGVAAVLLVRANMTVSTPITGAHAEESARDAPHR